MKLVRAVESFRTARNATIVGLELLGDSPGMMHLDRGGFNVAVTASDSNGRVIGTSSVNLAPYSKTVSALRTLPGLTGMVGKVGSAQFSVSTGTLAVLGLRFGAAAFTSIPAAQQ